MEAHIYLTLQRGSIKSDGMMRVQAIRLHVNLTSFNYMGKIKIRGRLEPIEIENSRAQQIKDRKFGNNGAEKADPQDLVDLGEWSGEYSRIVEIELTKTRVDTRDTSEEAREREEKVAAEKWAKLTPEEKGKSIGWFGLAYSSQLGDYSAKPSEELTKKVQKVQAAYYKKNPTHTRVPSEAYGKLLPEKKGTASLAQKMSMDNLGNGKVCQNKKCGKKLSGNLDKFCSGSCMLTAQNGELSTE